MRQAPRVLAPRLVAPRVVASALALAAVLALSGCESREDKAERFYQSALSYLDAGDEEHALVELRNVFQYNGFHKDARHLYADLELKRGEVGDAYSQYLRLIEQYPDTADVRATLARLAIDQGNWDEAERHGKEAIRLAPDDPEVQAIGVALDYRGAIDAQDASAREEAARQATILLAQHPDLDVARRIVIDWKMAGPNPQDALPEIDKALAAHPDSIEFHMLKLRLLSQANDVEGTGAQLRAMYDRFPDNTEVQGAMVRWHLATGDVEGAEAFLKELAGSDTGPTDGHVALVQFIRSTRGAEAAGTELDRLIAANQGSVNADLYRSLRAGIDFDAGRQSDAVATLEDILATAEPSDQTRSIKVALARMLSATGNRVGARARVEEVLAEDATNVEALKLRAAWATSEDRPGEAIGDLRTALSQDPRDVDVLTLMAEAYERDGNLDLAGERLALAVEVSNSAPEPSLRYAAFLRRSDRPDVAETVLSDSRSANPGDVRLPLALADLWMSEGEYNRVREVVDTLDAADTDAAHEAAQQLRASLLLAQNRTSDGIALLQDVAANDGDVRSVAAVVQAMLRQGQAEEAKGYLGNELAKAPDSVGLRLLQGSLDVATGDVDAAEATFRTLLEEDPANEAAVRPLYALLVRSGRTDEASAILDQGLAAHPDSGALRWLKAGELEVAGDVDGAIAIYEGLYAEDSFNVVVANNLASLIATHKDDPASLDRAFAIARRLRGTDQPAFQDTYGWILQRRGSSEEALTYLQPAAASLPRDPIVQFHLGMTYAALGRTEEARAALTQALEAGGDRPLPQMDVARETLASLDAGAPAPGAAPEPAATDAAAPTDSAETAPTEAAPTEAAPAGATPDAASGATSP